MGGASGAARARHMLGNYEILETVGRGGMGVVYRAYDHVLGRTVALKVLRDDLRVQAHLVSRFQREARAVAALDHTNIVQVFAVGSIDNVPFISMEFIEGRPLNAIVRENEYLEWERAFHIAGQIAQGLAAAHDKGIYHRDIKPANILIDAADRAYITDFGIAKVMNADTQLTIDGSRLGTPHYMSPERCEGREATHRSDLYALGVVLFQCLTGRLPFEAPTPAELIEKIIADLPPRVAKYQPDLPEDVDRLVAWTLEKNPRHRPADGHILADSLQRVLAGMPLEEEGPNLASALAEFRENFSTPTPHARSAEVTSREKTKLPWKKRIGHAWRATPFSLRLTAATVVSFLAAAAAVAFLAPPANVDPVSALAQAPGQALERWERSAALGAFRAEAPGVDLAALQLPGYTVDALVPAPNGAAWSALLRSSADPAAPALRVWLDWDASTAAFSAPPDTNRFAVASIAARWPGADGHLTVLENSVAGSLNRWLVMDRVNRRPDFIGGFVSSSVNQPQVLPFALGAFCAAPDGAGLVAAINNSGYTDQGWYLADLRYTESSLRFGHAITKSGGPIRQVALAPDGQTVVYLRETEEDLHTIRVARAARQEDGVTIATGYHALPEKPLRSDGALLLIGADYETPGVSILQAETGEVIAQYPGAGYAAWLDGQDALVLAAPDRRGDRQIWYVRRGSSETRQQLTFLAGGIGLPIQPSARGHAVAAPAAGTALPSVVMARVPGI
jgi:serine/threonine protein kinase